MHWGILTTPNTASCTWQVLHKFSEIIIKHCTLPFRASTGRENKFGGGNEDRKEADLTSQQADPTADLSLGTTESEFEHDTSGKRRLVL